MLIRQENYSDYADIRSLVKQVFQGVNEANLIDELRETSSFVPELSLVFEKENEIIGHILFSKIKIKAFSLVEQQKSDSKKYLAIAPLSVATEYQHQGIGKSLVDFGIDKAKELGFDAVIAFGEPEFYHEFGFKPSFVWDIFPSFEIDDKEKSLVLELSLGALVSGVAEFSSPFDCLYSHECKAFKEDSV